MSNYYSILTNAGIQKEILAKATGVAIQLQKMAVGDGEITPTQSMTSLKSEKYRFNINSILQDTSNPNYLVVEGVIPSSVGGFTVREVGIYLADNTFYAVGNLPATIKPNLTEGSAKDLTIKIIIEVSNADNIVLKVDESVVLATRNYVQTELKKHTSDKSNPHEVTKMQVGLDRVDNTPDKDKEVLSTRFLSYSTYANDETVETGLKNYFNVKIKGSTPIPVDAPVTAAFKTMQVGSIEYPSILGFDSYSNRMFIKSRTEPSPAPLSKWAEFYTTDNKNLLISNLDFYPNIEAVKNTIVKRDKEGNITAGAVKITNDDVDDITAESGVCFKDTDNFIKVATATSFVNYLRKIGISEAVDYLKYTTYANDETVETGLKNYFNVKIKGSAPIPADAPVTAAFKTMQVGSIEYPSILGFDSYSNRMFIKSRTGPSPAPLSKWAEFYTTDNENLLREKFGLKIGDIVGAYEIGVNRILATGGVFSRASYPKLWAWLQGKSFLKEESQYQTELLANGGYCGFYSAGDGNSTFRVPQLSGAFARFSTRGAGNFEDDMFKAHSHNADTYGRVVFDTTGGNLFSGMDTPTTGTNNLAVTNNTGGNETRPKNFAFYPLIIAN